MSRQATNKHNSSDTTISFESLNRAVRTHILCRYRHVSREDEDYARKSCPCHGPEIDDEAELSEVEGSRLKSAEQHLANDGNAVGPVERDRSHTEDGGNGEV